ncbi:MAG: 5'/3'-nucleotidase SurE [Actinomycetota bacterium]
MALTVLVTNDDGIGAPGLDAVVKALQQSPNFTVVVVAPATNQSGTGGKTTPGGAKGTKGSTKSGTSGTAVDGYPADSVNYAIDSMGLKPDVVVSGANSGVNFGALVAISGTIGAARAAARRGVPAIAVSAGVDDPVSAAAGAQFVVDEINAHRTAYGFAKNTDHTVVSINVPNCAAGTSVRGIIDAPTSPAVKLADIGKYETFDCASTATDPVDDITAVDVGFASRSIVPADL